MSVLLRFLLLHAVIGFGVAALLVAAILFADPGGLGTLLRREGVFPVALLWFFLGLTYGSVQMGAAVMLLPHEPKGGRGHRAPDAPAGGWRLVPARAGARSRR